MCTHCLANIYATANVGMRICPFVCLPRRRMDHFLRKRRCATGLSYAPIRSCCVYRGEHRVYRRGDNCRDRVEQLAVLVLLERCVIHRLALVDAVTARSVGGCLATPVFFFLQFSEQRIILTRVIFIAAKISGVEVLEQTSRRFYFFDCMAGTRGVE